MVHPCFPSTGGRDPERRRLVPSTARFFLPGLFALLSAVSFPAAAAETPGRAPQRDPRLDAPLLEAAEAGDAAKVKILLDQGADPKTCNRFGWPASVLAARRGHTEVLRRLYERDEDTAEQNAPGHWTPIIEAAKHSHLEAVRFLLACHVEPQEETDEGDSAEGYAEGRGYREIVALLRQASGQPPEIAPATDGESPLVSAATDGDAAVLARLLDGGESVESRNQQGQTLLICAVRGDRTEAVRLLLARHADPNNLSLFGCSALDFAVDRGREEIVKLLLEAGADPNGFRSHDAFGDGFSPLFQSFKAGRVELVKLLLAHGARLDDTNNAGDTALLQAARWPHVETLAFLVAQGQSVQTANRYGCTPLMYAATNGCEENIRFLLAHGADLQAKAKNRNPERRTGQPFGALEAAIIHGEPYAQEILIDAGARPANPGAALTEELFKGIDGKDFERVQAALHKGASANDPDDSNRHPLQVAVLEGELGLVRLLLKSGADPNGSPGDGPASTPLGYARERLGAAEDAGEKQIFTRIIELLQQAHATR